MGHVREMKGGGGALAFRCPGGAGRGHDPPFSKVLPWIFRNDRHFLFTHTAFPMKTHSMLLESRGPFGLSPRKRTDVTQDSRVYACVHVFMRVPLSGMEARPHRAPHSDGC